MELAEMHVFLLFAIVARNNVVLVPFIPSE